MAKIAISVRVSEDVLAIIDGQAEQAKMKRSQYVSKRLNDLFLGKEEQKILRMGKALDCPMFILPMNPKSAWVDLSVCQSCDKKFRGKPCPSWEDYQASLRVKGYSKKSKTKKKGE